MHITKCHLPVGLLTPRSHASAPKPREAILSLTLFARSSARFDFLLGQQPETPKAKSLPAYPQVEDAVPSVSLSSVASVQGPSFTIRKPCPPFFPLLRRPFLVLGKAVRASALAVLLRQRSSSRYAEPFTFPASFGNGGVLRATHQQETFASSPDSVRFWPRCGESAQGLDRGLRPLVVGGGDGFPEPGVPPLLERRFDARFFLHRGLLVGFGLR